MVSVSVGADQIAPDVVGQFGPGGGNEFVQALEIACRFEQMLGFGLVHGRFPLPDRSRIRPRRARTCKGGSGRQGCFLGIGLRPVALPGRVSGIAIQSSAVAAMPTPARNRNVV